MFDDGEAVSYEEPKNTLCQEWLQELGSIEVAWEKEFEEEEGFDNEQGLPSFVPDFEVEKEEIWVLAFADGLTNEEDDDKTK